MKSLKCDQCEVTAEGETFEEWMRALMPHYVEAHADYMKSQVEMSEEQQKAAQAKWLEDNKKRFDEA